MRRPVNVGNFFSVLYRLLRPFRHAFLRLFRSIVRTTGIVDIRLRPDRILGPDRWPDLPVGRFFVGFLIRKFRTRLSPARQTRPASFDRFACTDIRHNTSRPSFLRLSYSPFSCYEYVRDFSAELFFRSRVGFLRLPTLWIMSRMAA